MVAGKDHVWGQEFDFQLRPGLEFIYLISSCLSGFGEVDLRGMEWGPRETLITTTTADHYEIETETTPESGEPWVLTNLLTLVSKEEASTCVSYTLTPFGVSVPLL